MGFKEGEVIAGTEWLKPAPDIYTAKRLGVETDFRIPYPVSVVFAFSTEHVFSTTQKSLLERGANITFLAIVHEVDSSENRVTLHPLFFGSPLIKRFEDNELRDDLSWHSRDFYQIDVEDVREFSRLKEVSPIGWEDFMRVISERHVKESFAALLGDLTQKDWGGEIDDHFSTSIHVGPKRYAASFLLKGPSEFREMKPTHLGTNGDQIFRMCCSSANLLIVQHCHQIGHAVREQLRAFACLPSRPRRYCFIDGKDTFRILKAYGFLPKV